MRIRQATEEDMKEILAGGENFYHEARLWSFGFEWCPESFEKTVLYFIDSRDAAIFVATVASKVVGSAAGVIAGWPFNHNQKVMQEFWWFVEAEHRGGTAAVRLLKSLIEWGKQMGAVVNVLAHMEIHNKQKLDGIYKKMGFSVMESHYARGS